MIKTMGIVANLNKTNAVSVTNKIINFLKKHNIKVVLESSLANAMKKNKLGYSLDKMAGMVDLVIALGGDGTFLRVARVIQKHLRPILGINLGKLGFLAEVTLDSLEDDLKLLVKGKYSVDYRMTLNAEVFKKGGKKIKVQPALNDVVISKEAIARIINLHIYIDNKHVTTYRADGIIVATPTGSTAYALSAGGPIVYPSTDAILVAPICPHTLTHRPLIIPSNIKVKIKLDSPVKDVLLTVDGQVGLELRSGDSIVVSKGSKMVPLVVFDDTSYFELLRHKLHWGGR